MSMNNTSGAYYSKFLKRRSAFSISTKFRNKLNIIHETWSRKFAAYRKPYSSKKKNHIACCMPPIYAAWNRGEHSSPYTSSTFQRWQFTYKEKHDLWKRSTFYFLYKELMYNCWNTSHKQCVKPQRDHRNFMAIKIKLCEQKPQYGRHNTRFTNEYVPALKAPKTIR
jgi:hypothetical protein